ncbi:MAG: di-heme oxidoredictase family protein [Pseudomonas sp.]|uniref:di-heme oxidoreductase family protein n=1 Tax=Pseudomonas sp. TaxID=306 RepID=UPI002718764D|nr:di-heme oxidoredictase family protein [Pseudomonas sp.]MDO9616265.1 di-heme oxidoredictase family protein [Pseudomonas sp.]MDP2447838.1 di-heme oxidoredictase family protein [Pseudomonas sp.]MDZ4332216.1 di-heme oxidoredictase family protein [Pseudomonas sp.]
MFAPHRVALLLALSLSLVACDKTPQFTQAEPGEALSAGSATVRKADQNAFSLPSANLSPTRRLDFSVGNSFFRNPWVTAPATTTARDGLGPLFNTNACQNCHIKDGRGHPPGPDAQSAVSMLVRLSIPTGSEHAEIIQRLGVLAEPTYGGQLQDMANPGVAPEGKVRVSYSTQQVNFADGLQVELRQPSLDISQLGYGDLHPDTLFSARIAPPMIGLGLLEAIPEAAILANADPEDSNGDGISGRANQVWDREQQRTVLGRFGWKAGQPSLNQQNAEAFAGDMGLTSSLVSQDNCTEAQADCRSAPHGGEPEVSDNILASVLFYTRNLGVPTRRGADTQQVLAGKNLFYQAGCQSCHTPQFTTAADAAEPELANQLIRPYSDLLLHDMGAGLADHRPEFLASGSEWRTPPLWGIGLTETVNGHTQFLHDGRARNLLEAILWHGGEAEAAKQQVMTFNADERSALLAFLNSL